jgi:hypothetical protein
MDPLEQVQLDMGVAAVGDGGSVGPMQVAVRGHSGRGDAGRRLLVKSV